MVKKIFDILPPGKLEKKEVRLEKEHRPRLKKSEIKISLPPLKKNLFFIPLFLIGIFCYFGLPYFWGEAEIEIWPETAIKTFETKLTAYANVENINFSASLISATIFEEEKTFSQEFPSSGKKLIKKTAEGVIRVYNNYQSPQTLVKYTRLQPALEKVLYFCTKEGITIPAKSELDVEVFACEKGGEYAPAFGEEYNIKPSTFAVPGLAGTSRYTFIYGRSFQLMKGGEVREVSIVSQKDLEEAKDILIKKVKEEVEIALKEKIPPEFDLLKDALETKILEITPLAQVGQELEKFNFQVKAKSKALVFKPEDIKNFLISFISSQIPSEKKVAPKSLKMSYFPENINLELAKIPLSLRAQVKIFSDIDEISLKKSLSGKSLNETKIFLENQPEITGAEVKFWPFWLKRIPEDLRKIKIKLNFGID